MFSEKAGLNLENAVVEKDYDFENNFIKDIEAAEAEVFRLNKEYTLRTNIDIFNDTMQIINSKYYLSNKKLVESTKVYVDGTNHLIPFTDSSRYLPSKLQTPIKTFLDCSTVSAGIIGVDKGYKTAILNFADGFEKGGLVLKGAPTQEESICRCSNLYLSLCSPQAEKEYYDFNRKNNTASDRLIYSPDVTFVKNGEYETLKHPVRMDVISCPAPMGHEATEDILKHRMKCIVGAAIDNGIECLVLGAWGCGVFGNSPEIVAKCFKAVLADYGGNFKEVFFAIKPNDGDLSDHKLSIFEYEFM